MALQLLLDIAEVLFAWLAVNLQEVVHSAQAGNADVAKPQWRRAKASAVLAQRVDAISPAWPGFMRAQHTPVD